MNGHFALEVDLVVLVEVLDVLRGADVEDGIELIAFDATEVQPDEPVDVLGGVDGVAGEVGLQPATTRVRYHGLPGHAVVGDRLCESVDSVE